MSVRGPIEVPGKLVGYDPLHVARGIVCPNDLAAGEFPATFIFQDRLFSVRVVIAVPSLNQDLPGPVEILIDPLDPWKLVIISRGEIADEEWDQQGQPS